MKNPVHPIQVNWMDFLSPESADTRPPDYILKWYSPFASLEMVIGSRLETTMRCFADPRSISSGRYSLVWVLLMLGRVGGGLVDAIVEASFKAVSGSRRECESSRNDAVKERLIAADNY
jgi:hypothetical protein